MLKNVRNSKIFRTDGPTDQQGKFLSRVHATKNRHSTFGEIKISLILGQCACHWSDVHLFSLSWLLETAALVASQRNEVKCICFHLTDNNANIRLNRFLSSNALLSFSVALLSFSVAYTRLYTLLCPSVCPSVILFFHVLTCLHRYKIHHIGLPKIKIHYGPKWKKLRYKLKR